MFSDLAKRTAGVAGVAPRDLARRFAEALANPLRLYRWRGEAEKARAMLWVDSLRRQHRANGVSIVSGVVWIYEADVLLCVYRVPSVIIKPDETKGKKKKG